MVAGVIQLLLVLLAGAVLFRLWRAIAVIDSSFGRMVGVGLIGRSLLGQLLFWISELELYNRGLNYRHGIWFFAVDGGLYMEIARGIADDGLLTIFTRNRSEMAGTFVDVLAFFAMMFGGIASIGVLLNLFCYVAACWMIVHFSEPTPAARTPTRLALFALTFYPAGILWSSQPLKDTMAHLLLVALPVCALLWQRSWRDGSRGIRIAGAAVGLWIMLFGISGMRWYLGVAVLGGLGLFLVLMIFTVPRRKGIFVAASLLLIVLLGQAIVRGSDRTPPPIRNVLTLRMSGLQSLGSAVVRSTDRARSQFVQSSGGTEIKIAEESSRAMKLGAGLIAMTVPHFVIESLAFLRIEGGRGLFWFADLDTFVFDLVAVASIVLLLRQRRIISWSSPLLWLVMSTVVLLTVPLLYTVTNFGALLRMRGMTYVLLVMAPLAAVWTEQITGPSTPSPGAS